MFALIIIGVFVLIVAIIIYFEYKNEKDYQAERKKRTQERKKTKPPYNPKTKVQQPLQNKKEESAKRKKATPGAKEKVKPESRKNPESYELKRHTETIEPQTPSKEQATPEKVEKLYDLPKCKYPEFNYSRLIKMGLSEEEAIEFTKELIPQIKAQIPLIEEAFKKEDFHSMERLTHSIKGSSTTVGTGGVSDLLVECNTYLKTGKDLPIAEAYIKHLKYYADELEKKVA